MEVFIPDEWVEVTKDVFQDVVAARDYLRENWSGVSLYAEKWMGKRSEIGCKFDFIFPEDAFGGETDDGRFFLKPE